MIGKPVEAFALAQSLIQRLVQVLLLHVKAKAIADVKATKATSWARAKTVE